MCVRQYLRIPVAFGWDLPSVYLKMQLAQFLVVLPEFPTGKFSWPHSSWITPQSQNPDKILSTSPWQETAHGNINSDLGSQSFFPSRCTYIRGGPQCKQYGSRPTPYYSTLISNLQPPEPWEIDFCCFKPLSLWLFCCSNLNGLRARQIVLE